jgi:hypothetical protein
MNRERSAVGKRGCRVSVEPQEFYFLQKIFLDRKHIFWNFVIMKTPAVFIPAFQSFFTPCLTDSIQQSEILIYSLTLGLN